MHKAAHQSLQSSSTSLNEDRDEPTVLNALGAFTYLHMILSHALGLVPETLPMESMHRILNVSSKGGAWERDIARAYPHLDEVRGTHPLKSVVASAQSLLKDASLGNVAFSEDMLPLKGQPSDTFDFVVLQFLSPFISPLDWQEQLNTCYRVLRPGGFLMWREAGKLQTINPACIEWHDLINRALEGAGYASDMTDIMEVFVEETRYKEIQTCHFSLDLSSGTSAHGSLAVHFSTFFDAVSPFLLKMQVTTDTYLQQLFHEIEKECLLQTFSAVWRITTVVAKKSERG